MEESPEKDAQAGNRDAGQEEEEGMEESPGHSSSESEDDSDGDGLAAFMWGRRFQGQLPHDQGEEEEDVEEVDEMLRYDRKFFWSHYVDSGFPNRVNHAVCPFRDKDGVYYSYSLGGYYADEDDRTVLQADAQGGPIFKSSPIDIHCLDYAGDFRHVVKGATCTWWNAGEGRVISNSLMKYTTLERQLECVQFMMNNCLKFKVDVTVID